MNKDEIMWQSNIAQPSRIPYSSRVKQRLDNYRPRNESQHALLSVACLFSAGELDPPFLLIYGPAGLGKTHIAWAISWEYLEDYTKVLYYQAEEMLDELRSSYGSGIYEKRVEWFRTVPLLVIDDLGAQSNSDWGTAKLDMIIDYRYRNKLPTIITTNTLDISERILDRMCEGTVKAVKGESYRKKREGSL